MNMSIYDFIDGDIRRFTFDNPIDYFDAIIRIGGPSKIMNRFEYETFLLSFVFLTHDGRFEIYEEAHHEQRGIVRFDDYDSAHNYFQSKLSLMIEECHMWQESCSFRTSQ